MDGRMETDEYKVVFFFFVADENILKLIMVIHVVGGV